MLQFLKKHFWSVRLLKFMAVGASGVLVNMGLFWFFREIAKMDYKIASILAIEVSILTNFLLNDVWTWHDRDKHSLVRRLLRYHVSTGLTALVFNWGILVFLTEVVKFPYLHLSNLAGIAAGTVSNYLLNNLWTFRNKGTGHEPGR